MDDSHYVIFEHLGSENEEKEWANYRLNEGKGVMMWGKTTQQYNQLSMGWSQNSGISWVGHKSRSSFQGMRLLGYAESHDEERLLYNNSINGNALNGYDTKDPKHIVGTHECHRSSFILCSWPKNDMAF